MKTTHNIQENLVTLATPYYGLTTRPQGRLENIYIKLIANPLTGEYSQAGLCVWDPKKMPQLPAWLSRQGVSTLLCNDKPLDTEQSFSAAGISIFRKPHADLPEMVSDWKNRQTTGETTLAA
ncbi:MAG: hypothetical protein RQ754_12810 [Desulfuromonadales bacterium]|jgi:predicted Fe-Mo cluster-binding NifX family protein|nr:hypothetical protein [Desulfuromonadales bacterium]